MIENYKDQIRSAKKENILLFNHNKLIYRNVGTSTSVSFDLENKHLAENGLLIHNHLNDTSFSISDIKNTVELDVQRIELVTEGSDFILTRPMNGWNLTFNQETEKFVRQCLNFARETIEKEILKNNINIVNADNEINHYLWLLFFERYGIKYERKRILQ